MSESKIRRLLSAHLISKLKQPDGKLKYPLMQNGIQGVSPTGNYIVGHLIPSPSDSETLAGDHVCYTGIYQMTVRASNTDSAGQLIPDMNVPMDEMVDYIRNSFKINTRLTDTSGFTVQVMSPLKVTEARNENKEPWWTVHTYFNYRADTN